MTRSLHCLSWPSLSQADDLPGLMIDRSSEHHNNLSYRFVVSKFFMLCVEMALQNTAESVRLGKAGLGSAIASFRHGCFEPTAGYADHVVIAPAAGMDLVLMLGRTIAQ